MPTAAKKNEVNELISSISDLFGNPGASEFAIRRVERDAEEMLRTRALDPWHYHMLLSLSHMVRCNREAAESAARNAIALAPRDGAVLGNAACVFNAMGSTRQAVPLIRNIVEFYPDDKEMLASATIYAYQALQLRQAGEYLERLDKLRLNDNKDPVDCRIALMRTSAANRDLGMSDSDLLDRVETAVSVVRDNGYEVVRTSSLTLHDGTFLYHLHIKADRSTCGLMNFHIADALVDRYENSGVDLFTVVCLPFEDFQRSSNVGTLS